MGSNGSTSMASICGGCLSLMDAGVPIIAPVAGISCGLMTENAADGSIDKWVTVTDILGEEDHFGDMDFKLAGTTKGITGFQLDLKINGLPFEIATAAIHQAREARVEILKAMLGSLPAPRANLSKYAPRIQTIQIDPEKIGLLIGPGGKTIRRITETTGAQIDIAEDDSGKVFIYSNNAEAMSRAVQEIDAMCGGGSQIEVGKLYQGRVTGIKEFGCFVECMPGKEGLCHISELADFRVRRTEDVVKMGDMIWVKCVGIDERTGKVRLSRKAAMKEMEAARRSPPGRRAAEPAAHLRPDQPEDAQLQGGPPGAPIFLLFSLTPGRASPTVGVQHALPRHERRRHRQRLSPRPRRRAARRRPRRLRRGTTPRAKLGGRRQIPQPARAFRERRGQGRLGCPTWVVDGTPSDCVNIALAHLLPQGENLAVDGVVSGINVGVNASLGFVLGSGCSRGPGRAPCTGSPPSHSPRMSPMTSTRSSRPRRGFLPWPCAADAGRLRAARRPARRRTHRNDPRRAAFIVHNVNFPLPCTPASPPAPHRARPPTGAGAFQPPGRRRHAPAHLPDRRGPLPPEPLTDRAALAAGWISHTILDYTRVGVPPSPVTSAGPRPLHRRLRQSAPSVASQRWSTATRTDIFTGLGM